jgi:hypothetical protein
MLREPGRQEVAMQVRKQTVVEFIKERGDGKRVAEAEEILPDDIDTERDEALLARLGVEADDLDDEAGPFV